MNAPASPLALERPEFNVGHFPAMPAEQYHAIEAMSASGAKKMLRSPAHYRLMRDEPSTPTESMEFGTAVHCGILEPTHYAARIVEAPECDRRTKVGKETWAAFCVESVGKIALPAKDFGRAWRCIDAVRGHPSASRLLHDAAVEGSMFWFDQQFGVPCKARYDARNLGGIIDVKTCQDASAEAFARQAANLLYHVQAAHYISGAEHVLNATPEFFAWICVESEPPHAVACYLADGAAVLAGARHMNTALERYKSALNTGTWSGYPEAINRLPFPRWALSFTA